MQKFITVMLLSISIFISGCRTLVSDYPSTDQDNRKYSSDTVEDLDYDTNSYVIETLGEGAIACINIGSDDSISQGVKVEFYRIVERNGEKFEVVFASGVVFRTSDTTAWVKVNNPKKVNVMQNHFVRISENQKKSLFEEAKEFLGGY
jgi:hypothetical protein